MFNFDTPSHFLSAGLRSTDVKLDEILVSSKSILGGDPGKESLKVQRKLARYIHDNKNRLYDRYLAIIRFDWLDGSLPESRDQIKEYFEKAQLHNRAAEDVYERMVNDFISTVERDGS